jgi:hypothetical protein
VETQLIVGDERGAAASGGRTEIRDPADLSQLVGDAAEASREDTAAPSPPPRGR